jgi:hypothetical protein
MARATLSSLITTLRELVDDGGTPSVFSDDTLQRHLDACRWDVYQEALAPIPAHIGGGSVAYYEYRSRHGNFETTQGGTAVLLVQDSTGATRGTATWADVDYQRGAVTFAANQAGTALYLTGRSYDLYAAAADTLTDWAAKVALQFDFSSDQQSFSRSQKQAQLRQAAESYRRQARPRTANLTRPDVAEAE